MTHLSTWRISSQNISCCAHRQRYYYVIFRLWLFSSLHFYARKLSIHDCEVAMLSATLTENVTAPVTWFEILFSDCFCASSRFKLCPVNFSLYPCLEWTEFVAMGASVCLLCVTCNVTQTGLKLMYLICKMILAQLWVKKVKGQGHRTRKWIGLGCAVWLYFRYCTPRQFIHYWLCGYVVLPRDPMCKRGLCCCMVPVRPSVCPLRWCIVSRWQKISSNISRPVSPMILVFDSQHRYPIARGTPSSGTQNTRGRKFLRFSTEIPVYLGNGTR